MSTTKSILLALTLSIYFYYCAGPQKISILEENCIKEIVTDSILSKIAIDTPLIL